MSSYDNIKFGMYYHSIQEINVGIHNNRYSGLRWYWSANCSIGSDCVT